jgi:hypothetical protein
MAVIFSTFQAPVNSFFFFFVWMGRPPITKFFSSSPGDHIHCGYLIRTVSVQLHSGVGDSSIDTLGSDLRLFLVGELISWVLHGLRD